MDNPEDIFLANDPKRSIATQDMVKRGDEFQLLNFDISKWRFDLEELLNPNHEAPPLGGSGEASERIQLSELESYSRAIPCAMKAQFLASPFTSLSPDEVLKSLKLVRTTWPTASSKQIAGNFLFWHTELLHHLVIVSSMGENKYKACRVSPVPKRRGENLLLYCEKVMTDYAPCGESRVCGMEPVNEVQKNDSGEQRDTIMTGA